LESNLQAHRNDLRDLFSTTQPDDSSPGYGGGRFILGLNPRRVCYWVVRLADCTTGPYTLLYIVIQTNFQSCARLCTCQFSLFGSGLLQREFPYFHTV